MREDRDAALLGELGDLEELVPVGIGSIADGHAYAEAALAQPLLDQAEDAA